ncbi:Class myosin [Salix suchowensis]|nr:Class myosin [Salix suchowensis]
MSVALNQRYSEASFELRVGRVGGEYAAPCSLFPSYTKFAYAVKSIKPLIGTIEHLRRELSWGMVHSRTQPAPLHVHSTSPDEKDANAFRVPAYELGHAVLTSMRVVERTVLTCYELNIMPRQRDEAKGNLDEALNSLYKAAVVARDVLKSFTDGLDMQQRAEDGAIGFPQKSFDLCLFMISLLQVSPQLFSSPAKITNRELLDGSRDEACLVPLQEADHSTRSIVASPVASALLVGLARRGSIHVHHGRTRRDFGRGFPRPQAETALSLTETLQGISENQYPSDQPDDNDPDGYPNNDPDDTPEVLRRRRIHGRVMSMGWMASVIHHVWNYAAVLRTRLKVSRTLRAVQHSSHLRHAIKNSGGIVLLSLPAFLPTDSSGELIPLVAVVLIIIDPEGYSWFYWARGQWMVISYLWVLETNTGATSGTILGCVYGYIVRLLPSYSQFLLTIRLPDLRDMSKQSLRVGADADCRHRSSSPAVFIKSDKMTIQLSELPISWIITNTTFPSLGVVAYVPLPASSGVSLTQPSLPRAVTLPPLTFVKFFSPKSEPSQISTSPLISLTLALQRR